MHVPKVCNVQTFHSTSILCFEKEWEMLFKEVSEVLQLCFSQDCAQVKFS